MKERPHVYFLLGLKFIVACFAFHSVDAAQWSPVAATNIYTLNTGNVGIGSTSPVYKLEVVSTTNAKLRIKSTSSPNPALLEVAGPASTGVFESVVTPSSLIRFGSRTNHDVSLITNNTDKLIIKSDGKVGIGKSSPIFPLDVNGIINASALYVNNHPVVSSQWINNGSNINFHAGIVSIGTLQSPLGYKLAVGGKIITEEIVVKIQANWPDYVFEKEYRLPPLSEIKKFIDENKRLPGVPSSRQVENGLGLGEINTVLVKKIEELTLYLIEQERRIEQLEKQLTQK